MGNKQRLWCIHWKSLLTGKVGSGKPFANLEVLKRICAECNAHYNETDDREYWIEEMRDDSETSV